MNPVWRKIKDLDVPAKPAGLWTKAVDYVGPSRRLRFQATGKWIWHCDDDACPPAGTPEQVAAGTGAPQPKLPESDNTVDPLTPPPAPAAPEGLRECGPDGDTDVQAGAGHLFQNALSGALIGKIGGSTAAIKDAGAFLIGSYAVIEIDDSKQGPLFLTINDTPEGMKDNRNSVHVTIWESL